MMHDKIDMGLTTYCRTCDRTWNALEEEPECVTPNPGPTFEPGECSLPDNNPKTRMGALKVPLHLVPPSARHYLALAFEDGATKYGPANWRDEPVSASVYFGAAGRHLDAYWDGEDLAKDSLVHHLAHTMACCAIILDAMECGTLNDDRYTKGPTAKLQARYLESKK